MKKIIVLVLALITLSIMFSSNLLVSSKILAFQNSDNTEVNLKTPCDGDYNFYEILTGDSYIEHGEIIRIEYQFPTVENNSIFFTFEGKGIYSYTGNDGRS